tara:strand:+ start:171 stop:293 length:123 start_codon:yes stop_codon:yes gene_type:complete
MTNHFGTLTAFTHEPQNYKDFMKLGVISRLHAALYTADHM